MEINKRIMVLIPAYMPGERLIKLCRQLVEMGFRVTVVNDGSGSGYNYYFNRLPTEVVVLSHTSNCGKGRALKTGLDYISRNFPSSLGVITADADEQHLLQDIIKVSKELENHEDSIILGRRQFDGKVPLKSKLGNLFTRWVFAASFGKIIDDTQTGLRGLPFRMIPDLLTIQGEKYEYEMNVLIWAAKREKEIREVKIKTVYLEGNESSHFRAVRDSLLIYKKILRFTLSSLASFALDFSLLILLRRLTLSLEPSLSLLISALGARAISSLFNFGLNKKLVFESKEKGAPEAKKYFMLAGAILTVNYGMLYLLNIVLGIPLEISKLGTELLLYVASYRVQNRHVFKDEVKTRIKTNMAAGGIK
ncbi:MAG: bifunctional glycosyltransferase family 2/GtrA family protein [Clostridiaceae bacterium]